MSTREREKAWLAAADRWELRGLGEAHDVCRCRLVAGRAAGIDAAVANSRAASLGSVTTSLCHEPTTSGGHVTKKKRKGESIELPTSSTGTFFFLFIIIIVTQKRTVTLQKLMFST
jgi:hypothetical protein